MVRPANAIGWIAVARENDFRIHLFDPRRRLLKGLQLEPEKNSVPVRFVSGVGDRSVVMADIEAVQLKNQSISIDQPLVLSPAVGALAAQQTLIPTTAGPDIGDANERLWIQGRPPSFS